VHLPIKKFSRWSIRSKFMFCSILTLVLTITFIAFYSTQQQEKDANTRLGKKVQEMGVIFATTIGASFKFLDFTALIQTVEGMKRNPDLSYLGIFDEQDKIISSFNPSGLQLNLPASIHKNELFHVDNICFFSTPIHFEKENFGNLVIGYSLENLQHQMYSAKTRTLLVCMVILLIGTLLIVTLSQILTKDIIKLKEAAQKFSPGEKRPPIQTESKDEVAELCTAYNRLIDEINYVVNNLKKNSLELQRHSRELEERNSELKDFIYIASHDFNEPLRKIVTFGDRLEQYLLDSNPDFSNEKGSEYLKRMQSASQRMSLLISDLLNYSKVIAQTDYEFHPIKLEDVIQQVLQDLEFKIRKSNAKIQLGPLPEIEIHPFQIQQVFMNLIGNSLKFQKNGTPPLIEITSEPSHCSNGNPVYKISVKDNGIGFNQKYMEKAFKPLERLVGRSEYEGTGMGLSICKRIIERHDGTITAKSSLGEGSTFIIVLPSKQVQDT
jgi:signal transduction histidine kinase